MKFLIVFALFALSSSFVAKAQDSLGELKVDQFFLEPAFSTEDRNFAQGFSIGRSFLGASWNLENIVSAHFLMGPKFLIQKPSRYDPGARPVRDLAFVEAYGEWDSGLGLLKAGLIKIPFGFYGLKNEAQINFPETLWDHSAFLQKRDYGASYFINYNSFVTTFAVHNGESDPDEDRRFWTTGRWSYQGAAGSELGFSASTGRWVDTGTFREQKIRIGNVFGGFRIYGLGLAAEASAMSVFESGNFSREAYSWHVDLEHPFLENMGLQLRWEHLEPNHNVLNDQVRELTYGLNYHSRYWNSVLYGLFTTRWEEGSSGPHTGLLVLWKLSPLTQ